MNEIITNNVHLIKGDCLEVMKNIKDKSIDMILCDLPYGITACEWDKIIDLELLWEQYNRIIKDNSAICLFSNQPFTTKLINSNFKMFKYCWYWKKSKPNGWQHSKNKPMSVIEEICVFSKAPMGHISLLGDKRMIYNPQGIKSGGTKKITSSKHGRILGARPNQVGKEYETFTGFPHNVLEYKNIFGKQTIHPTQKPVELLKYLIRTYTNDGGTILDNCMGSGSTGVATLEVGGDRKFIGIELNDNYFDIACNRIKEVKKIVD